MDTKLRKSILSYVFDKKRTTTNWDIYLHCLSEYNISAQDDIDKKYGIESKVYHMIDVLIGENLLDSGKGDESHFVFMTSKGYKEFDPWYKKSWNFINDDFAKLLSLVSIILSIIATIVSFTK